MAPTESHQPGQVAFVLKGYPRLSETFIAQEIHSLMNLGMDIAIYSLRHPTDASTHPVHDEITASVNYLPEYLHQEPLRVLKGLFCSLAKPGLYKALSIWWKDLKRDSSRSRVRRLGQAMVLATELPANTSSIHAHFMHTPASVTRYAAHVLDLPWTCSAHAKDIWTSPEWELREKLNDCEWLTTCTAANTEYLAALSDKNNVFLNYHGVDLARFPPAPNRNLERDGTNPEQPVQLLSVGRAVSKKGYFALLDALSGIAPERHWAFTHIGGGELLGELKNHAQKLGIKNRCQWLGAQPQQLVLQHYREADLFVLNSKIDDNGDRDGLPNVIVEAQSQSLAVLSTNISGIPELIKSGENGILVEQNDTDALSSALSSLISQPEYRKNLGQAGNRKVRSLLDKDTNIQQLYEQF
ncbi:MAG: glycosyltransferase family 4 protein [Proteobacteria bacterium]|nr:glycosyltransferase family 4 protein [Pseudomonadota bacterium]